MSQIKASIETDMTARDVIRAITEHNGAWGCVVVPEFTFQERRIDAALIDTRQRRVRGFEVKVSRSDFLSDEKWQLYTAFTSDLSIACPAGLIQPEEVPDPFGLLWCTKEPGQRRYDGQTFTRYGSHWKKRPKNFQKRGGLAWQWRYLEIIETEFKRLAHVQVILQEQQDSTKP